ncbi:DUF3870 domain-containing protein [Qaidamihabitans albus]|uniref:DUF3870 domain-containing protein n=1 Tax=Qaidamihabitans albus TaxID=2795733 RepID=UPI0018F13A1F|nr:DUF3870 domain-containing protein [Qaidamihabitans albus]
MGREIIVTGYAKMPTGTMVRALYGTLAMGARVDIETHTIIEGWASLFAPQTQKWVSELLTGRNLMSDDTEFVDRIQRDYWGSAQGAICQCYRDMVRRYRETYARQEAGSTSQHGSTPATQTGDESPMP